LSDHQVNNIISFIKYKIIIFLTSDHSPGNYSLFFYVENTVQRFRIERRYDDRYGNCFLTFILFI